MRLRIPHFERPSLALLAAVLVASVPSGAWAAASIATGSSGAVPIVSTNAATAIAATSASLPGTVNPNGRSTSFYFAWLKTGSSSWSSTPPTSAGSGSSDRSVSADLSGLSPSTTYHFWIVATNSQGTSVSADRMFTTLPPPPVVTTGAATALDQTSATLSADINPNGLAATFHFEVGVSTQYGSHWPASDAAAGSDSVTHTVTQPLSGLLPGTTYHYRAVATTASGTTNGVDHQFSTPGTPAPVAPGTPGAPDTPGLAVGLPPATPPVLGRSATIAAVSGTVLVELPGAATALSLAGASTVPVGTRIDATSGTVKLTNVRDTTGKLQTATFWGGSFTVHQTRGKKTSTVLSLTAPMTCPKSARHLSALTAKNPRSRQLWGKDHNGRFVTRGRAAVATVRGTLWLLRDTCAGTLVKVTRGEVAVRDLVKKRTAILEAGHSYLARSK